jgi:6-pyruvoyltetrahydropterin/6-carboxytetrahydropterin synthase
VPGVYEVTVNSDFSAAHRLTGHAGPCARVHGHNWKVTAHVRCRRLNEEGMALDFLHLHSSLEAVLAVLDHKELNAVPFFTERPPTAENVARFIFDALGPMVNTPDATLSRVTVHETTAYGAAYWEEE